MFKIIGSTTNRAMIIKLSILGVLYIASLLNWGFIAFFILLVSFFMLCEFHFKSIIYLLFFASWHYEWFIWVNLLIAFLYALIGSFKIYKFHPTYLGVISLSSVLIIFNVYTRLSWLIVFSIICVILLKRARELNFTHLSWFFIAGVLISCSIGLLRFYGFPAPLFYKRFDSPLLGFCGLMAHPNYCEFVLCAICAVLVLNFHAPRGGGGGGGCPLFFFFRPPPRRFF
jgi:hypothetical protein